MIPYQTLRIYYYVTTLSQNELKNVMVKAFQSVNVTTFNSEEIYYVYMNNGSYAEFVGIIGSHVVVVINYPELLIELDSHTFKVKDNSAKDILSCLQNPISTLLELVYDINSYMESELNSGLTESL